MPPAVAIASWLEGDARARREIARAAFSGAAAGDVSSSRATSMSAIACSFSSFSEEMAASAPAACICASSASEPSKPTRGEMPSRSAMAFWFSKWPEARRQSAAADAAATAEPSLSKAAFAPFSAMSSSSSSTCAWRWVEGDGWSCKAIERALHSLPKPTHQPDERLEASGLGDRRLVVLVISRELGKGGGGVGLPSLALSPEIIGYQLALARNRLPQRHGSQGGVRKGGPR